MSAQRRRRVREALKRRILDLLDEFPRGLTCRDLADELGDPAAPTLISALKELIASREVVSRREVHHYQNGRWSRERPVTVYSVPDDTQEV